MSTGQNDLNLNKYSKQITVTGSLKLCSYSIYQLERSTLIQNVLNIAYKGFYLY